MPQLRFGDIIIWDNVAMHKITKVKVLIESTGASIEPLPAYSPDLNPNEECISKVKTELRRAKANTYQKLKNALRRAFSKVSPDDIRGWVRHSGYVSRRLNASILKTLRNPVNTEFLLNN